MLLSLALLSPSPALAKVAGCGGHWIAEVSPSRDAAGVPVDVVPQLVLAHEGCPDPVTWTLRLSALEASGEVEIAAEDVTLSGQPFEAYASFSTLPELAPDTPHVLSVYAGEQLLMETAFTTGQGRVAGLADGQDLDATLLQLSAQPSSQTQQRGGALPWTLFGGLEVDAVEDLDGLGALLLVDVSAPELPLAAARWGEGAPQTLTLTQVAEERDRGERCYQVLQTNGRAEVAAESLALCSSPTRGCQSAAGGGLAWVLALLGLTRRSRARVSRSQPGGGQRGR